MCNLVEERMNLVQLIIMINSNLKFVLVENEITLERSS